MNWMQNKPYILHTNQRLSIYLLAHCTIVQEPSREEVYHKCLTYSLQLSGNDPGSLNIILPTARWTH